MAEYYGFSDFSSNSDCDTPNDQVEDFSYSDLVEFPSDEVLPRTKARSARVLLLHHNLITLIPPDLCSFTNLISIDISNNVINSIANDICKMKHLRIFVAKNNQLKCESIPKDFGQLKSLEEVNFSGNQLGSLPPQFCELALHVGANIISDIPRAVKNLWRLEVLYLGGNQLTDLPPEIGQLQSLTALILCDNKLQSLPPTMIQLQRLKSLSLHNNQISTLPTEIVKLNLQELSLRNNPLVNKFVQDMVYKPPTLLELAGRIIKIEKIKYDQDDLPSNLVKYLEGAQRCVNSKCKGVYFASRFEHVKFVDFCGKYRVPLLQYLCSPSCHEIPAVYRSASDTETDDEVDNEKLRKVLLG
ncbi:hypothetical protein FSP39_025013 [Pinctada imbricata]|uniref:Disease resistance R13L4/SHOC-2-like LRR domain-containing protein n=1 Tax=Pinctada imbricata TaxID=66713 RepID=A0AA89CDM3_PINIB|nr:hypothetical protein FSP39_025013 [Pinctada imbricata]